MGSELTQVEGERDGKRRWCLGKEVAQRAGAGLSLQLAIRLAHLGPQQRSCHHLTFSTVAQFVSDLL